MKLRRTVGKDERGNPRLIEAICKVVEEHGAPDWVASALTHIVGVAHLATVFPATSLVLV